MRHLQVLYNVSRHVQHVRYMIGYIRRRRTDPCNLGSGHAQVFTDKGRNDCDRPTKKRAHGDCHGCSQDKENLHDSGLETCRAGFWVDDWGDMCLCNVLLVEGDDHVCRKSSFGHDERVGVR